ncbi:hypothetical protein FAI40_03435 [Acetobacteraceae bacterium]|nr:hypothetical protein FAI40_03435 [Acetobacteraceae bacterium]
MTKSKAPADTSKRKKEGRSEKATPRTRKPRKPKASVAKEGLEVKKENILSHLRPSASLPVEKKVKEVAKKEDSFAELGSFEGYCLRHWGKVNLYFLVPASMGAPLLGLWLRPDGMTPNFAVLIFLAVLVLANLISFMLILLVWALKGAK